MFEKQLFLIKQEQEYERAEFRKEIETQGVHRRIKRGNCWAPIKFGRSYYNSLDRLVVEVFNEAYDAENPVEHNFEYGKNVCFFSQSVSKAGGQPGDLKFLDIVCTVSYAEEDRMVVTLPNDAALSRLLSLERPGVALHFDETTYRLMTQALNRVEKAKGTRLAELRDIFHAGQPLSWGSRPNVEPQYPWLNASQQEAVRDVLRAKDVLIVHGPPGTGKTTTLVEAIDEVLRREPQVMVCAQSNTAVDWISKQLMDRGIEVLRVGNPTRVTDEMLACTYERRFEAHPDYPQLWQIRRDIRQLYSQPRKGRSEKFHQAISRLRDRAGELEYRIRTTLFDHCRVIACTLAGAASQTLEGYHCHTLFIDEAAQALEAACWIAIPHADRVIFAGDHCQLPPTIKNPECLRAGLGKTLMERIAEQKPAAVRLLTVQYRMNEELMRFSSDWFYDGRLTAADSVRFRSILDEADYPLVWIDPSPSPSLKGRGEVTSLIAENTEEEVSTPLPLREGPGGGSEAFSDLSIYNKEEAEYTIAALHLYIEKIGKKRVLDERIDFGVISPYKAQVRLLRQLVKKDTFLRPFRRAITINTVDAFQGQERDVVLISMVRANETGKIGFLGDLRRMNVAITRARYKVIIVGDATTLCRHRFYRELHHRCHVIG
ncbi:MAG: AAA domain-containing protein [Bacteroidales bacterium]|nr:AAA domain-containing protein [Bacteroidales bacterium]